MPLSFRKFTSTGQATYPIGFNYISPDHVQVLVDGTPRPVGYTLSNGNIEFGLPVPPAGVEIRLYRTTPGRTDPTKNNVIVDFVNGSTLSEDDLDTAVLQNFYLVQEAVDTAEGTLLQPNSITEPMFSDKSVSTRALADGSVTEPKVANNAVSTRTVQSNSITEPKLDTDSVSNRVLQDRSVDEINVQVPFLNTIVRTSGDQSIADIKTFSSIPQIPLEPTLANHATSKQYVDIGDTGYQGSTPSELNLPLGSAVLATYYDPGNFLFTASQANQTLKVWCNRFAFDQPSEWAAILSSYVVTAATDSTVPATQELTPRPYFQLQGTWKSRGFFNQSAGAAFVFLVQRIA